VKILERLGKLGPIFRDNTISSSGPLPTGPVKARFEFIADEPKPATGGKTRLLVNGNVVAEGKLEHTVPGRFSAYACMDIGKDNRKPVSYTYKSPFPFTGTIKTVTFDLEPTTIAPAIKEELQFAHHATKVALGING
jgi:arylsulfatase